MSYKQFKLLKVIELQDSLKVWSIFTVHDDKVMVDWCGSMSTKWFIKHWYIEEVKALDHFGNGMITWGEWYYIDSSEIITEPERIKVGMNMDEVDRSCFRTKGQAQTLDTMMQLVYRIRQRHSENDEGCGLYDIFYDGEERDWNRNKDWQATNFFLPMFSSQKKAQACIDHFNNELNILLGWYNMQKSNDI